jgi:hypothetical protein
MTVPPESELFNVATATRPTFERVLGTQLDADGLKASEVGLRPLAVATHQLQAAHVGAHLESLACEPTMGDVLRDIVTDYGSLAHASLNLTVRCSESAVDLCAAALGRLCETWPKASGREADVATLHDRPKDFASPDTAVSAAVTVLTAATAQSSWDDVQDLRHRLTHRTVVRSHMGYVGPTPVPAPLFFAHSSALLGGKHVDLDVLTRDVVALAESTFRDVCQHLTP